jgi:hypothetical protein
MIMSHTPYYAQSTALNTEPEGVLLTYEVMMKIPDLEVTIQLVRIPVPALLSTVLPCNDKPSRSS